MIAENQLCRRINTLENSRLAAGERASEPVFSPELTPVCSCASHGHDVRHCRGPSAALKGGGAGLASPVILTARMVASVRSCSAMQTAYGPRGTVLCPHPPMWCALLRIARATQ